MIVGTSKKTGITSSLKYCDDYSIDTYLKTLINNIFAVWYALPALPLCLLGSNGLLGCIRVQPQHNTQRHHGVCFLSPGVGANLPGVEHLATQTIDYSVAIPYIALSPLASNARSRRGVQFLSESRTRAKCVRVYVCVSAWCCPVDLLSSFKLNLIPSQTRLNLLNNCRVYLLFKPKKIKGLKRCKC